MKLPIFLNATERRKKVKEEQKNEEEYASYYNQEKDAEELELKAELDLKKRIYAEEEKHRRSWEKQINNPNRYY